MSCFDSELSWLLKVFLTQFLVSVMPTFVDFLKLAPFHILQLAASNLTLSDELSTKLQFGKHRHFHQIRHFPDTPPPPPLSLAPSNLSL